MGMSSYIGAPEDERGYWDDKVQPEPEEEDEPDLYTCPWCMKDNQTTEQIRECSGFRSLGMPPNENGHPYGCTCQDCFEEYRKLKMSAVPKLLHPAIGSAPTCFKCGENLSNDKSDFCDRCECRCKAISDADCNIRDVQRCIRLQMEADYGVVDERDFRAGRGMPRG